MRAVGEVHLEGDGAGDEQWARYESLFNRAFADLPVWVVCPYDARSVSDAVLADVRRTHPVVSTVTGREPSADHFSSHELGAAVTPLDGELDPRGVQGTATVVRNE